MLAIIHEMQNFLVSNLADVMNGDDTVAQDHQDELLGADLLHLHLDDRLLVVGVGLEKLHIRVQRCIGVVGSGSTCKPFRLRFDFVSSS